MTGDLFSLWMVISITSFVLIFTTTIIGFVTAGTRASDAVHKLLIGELVSFVVVDSAIVLYAVL